MDPRPESIPSPPISDEALRWLSLPEDARAELLDGRLIYKAMATIEHGAAAGEVFAQLNRFQGPPRGGRGGWWLSQEVRIYLSGQGLRPDLAGWRVDRHPEPPRRVNLKKRRGVYTTPPDWVCEVLSPSTRRRDLGGVKWRAYYQSGVGHYWLVDLANKRITVYQRGERSYELVEILEREEVRPLPPFESIEFFAERVFLVATLVHPDPEEPDEAAEDESEYGGGESSG